jgi:hypothetical protein
MDGLSAGAFLARLRRQNPKEKLMSNQSIRTLVAAGSLGRLSYALGLLLAPDWMSVHKLAAAENGNAYGRMTTRAFGAVHTNVSLQTLRAAARDRDMRLLLGLNLGCDLGDLAATVLEWRDGDLPVGALIGSAIVQSAGMAVWGTALRRL